ncbi:predicted protein [Streptomyces viridosporus ATCC 14672]|uniref:Predicted protein n=1 Tax=Streptomyces viridosporus (strain ATCC 14672 / DSM 40746 / JCM 4963 / KCTC 9882 / NRRL B-12104 / FH 1290) TaxID=566461 RepID=D5ZTE1_STRV1|nr:predicted protein [Streptomyces viridosporus ATCC 14672]
MAAGGGHGALGGTGAAGLTRRQGHRRPGRHAGRRHTGDGHDLRASFVTPAG